MRNILRLVTIVVIFLVTSCGPPPDGYNPADVPNLPETHVDGSADPKPICENPKEC